MIKDIFKEKENHPPFEVFPPKKEDDFANAFSIMTGWPVLKPDFISVTYGAGGSKSRKRWRSLPTFRISSISTRWPI